MSNLSESLSSHLPEPLRIVSSDRRSWVKLKRWRDATGDYEAFEMAASVDYGHGKFTALNADVQFFGLPEFIQGLDAFVMQRGLRPRLEGTYDCFLTFEGKGTQVVVSFCVGDAFCGGEAEVEEPRLRGRFVIDGERLNGIIEALRGMV